MPSEAPASSIRALIAWINYGARINFDTLTEHTYSQHMLKHGRVSILRL